MEFKRIAIDTSKAVFTLHGIDHHDKPILRRNLSRPAFEAFFAQLRRLRWRSKPVAVLIIGGAS